MKYKVGDRVRIKSIDWYNKNKNIFGKVWTNSLSGEYAICFDHDNAKYCGKVLTIAAVEPENYAMVGNRYDWTDEMIEELVEEGVGLVDDFSNRWINELKLPEGYIFKDENGNVINATKIVLEKKGEYPTTYKECCDVLGLDTMDNDAQGYKAFLIIQFQELLIARDAYWKIAGDWKEKLKEKSIHYVIYSTLLCEVVKDTIPNCIGNYLLDFPTQEMRDAFYENFKELIESVKELL